tara:strand:+ start:25048 stop:25164 length:117 start_codon:yes stop_codon:yes gene_type:complete
MAKQLTIHARLNIQTPTKGGENGKFKFAIKGIKPQGKP